RGAIPNPRWLADSVASVGTAVRHLRSSAPVHCRKPWHDVATIAPKHRRLHPRRRAECREEAVPRARRPAMRSWTEAWGRRAWLHADSTEAPWRCLRSALLSRSRAIGRVNQPQGVFACLSTI